jgi:hypothetical protein
MSTYGPFKKSQETLTRMVDEALSEAMRTLSLAYTPRQKRKLDKIIKMLSESANIAEKELSI